MGRWSDGLTDGRYAARNAVPIPSMESRIIKEYGLVLGNTDGLICITGCVVVQALC